MVHANPEPKKVDNNALDDFDDFATAVPVAQVPVIPQPDPIEQKFAEFGNFI